MLAIETIAADQFVIQAAKVDGMRGLSLFIVQSLAISITIDYLFAVFGCFVTEGTEQVLAGQAFVLGCLLQSAIFQSTCAGHIVTILCEYEKGKGD